MDGIMSEVADASLAPGHEASCKKESQSVRLVQVDLPRRQDDSPIPRNCTAPLISANVRRRHDN